MFILYVCCDKGLDAAIYWWYIGAVALYFIREGHLKYYYQGMIKSKWNTSVLMCISLLVDKTSMYANVFIQT